MLAMLSVILNIQPQVPALTFCLYDDIAGMSLCTRNLELNAQNPVSCPSISCAMSCMKLPAAWPCGLLVESTPYWTAFSTRRFGKFFFSKSLTLTLNELVVVKAASLCGESANVMRVSRLTRP